MPEISRKPSALIPKFWSFMRKRMVTRDKLYSCTQQSGSTIHRYRRLCRSSTTIRKSLELTKTIWGDKHLQYLCTIILWIEPYILLNIGNTNKQAIFQIG